MSEVAGKMSTQVGANHLAIEHGGSGVLLGEFLEFLVVKLLLSDVVLPELTPLKSPWEWAQV